MFWFTRVCPCHGGVRQCSCQCSSRSPSLADVTRIKFKTLWMTVQSYLKTTNPLKSHLINVKTTFLFTPQATSTWFVIWDWGDWRNSIVHGNVPPASMDNCISVSLQRGTVIRQGEHRWCSTIMVVQIAEIFIKSLVPVCLQNWGSTVLSIFSYLL